MDVYQERAKCDVRLDVSAHPPAHLRVFYVETNGKHWFGPDDVRYGTLHGDPGQIARLRQQLVHELPGNE